MVTHRTMYYVVLLVCFCVYNVRGASTDSSSGRTNAVHERQQLTEAIVKSVTEESHVTPIRTCETFVAGLTHGDFHKYLNCLTPELKKRVTGEDVLSEERVQMLDARFKQAGYKKPILHSFTLSLDGENPTMTLIVSSERGEFRIKEQMDIELIDTANGWKFSKMDSKILGREQIQEKH